MAKMLRQQGIFVGKKNQSNELEDLNKEIVEYENYLTTQDDTSYVRVSKMALTTVAMWSEMHDAKIVLADIPHSLRLYNLIQTTHLVDLREMLAEAIKLAHTDGTSCYEASLKLFPDLVLHHTDEYMATLIQELQLQQPELNTIFVVCGYGQSRSIPHYLFMSPKLTGEMHSSVDVITKYSALKQVTSHAPIYKSLLSQDTIQMQIDKLAILDILFGPLKDTRQEEVENKDQEQKLPAVSSLLIKSKLAQQSLLQKGIKEETIDPTKWTKLVEKES